jgi:hypothetical protein
MPASVLRAPALAAAVLLAAATPANAASTFFSAATGTVSLVSITASEGLAGLEFTAFDDSDASGLTEGVTVDSGDAFVGLFPDPLGLGVGFDLSVEAFADGTAGDDLVPAGGLVDRSSFATAFANIVNGTAGDVELVFQFDYTVDTGVSDTGALLNDAFGDASFVFNVNGAPEVFTAVFSDLALGPPSDTFSDSFLRTFILGAGESLDFDVTANASGFAGTVVPVPAAVWLFGSALAGLAGLRRRFA